jgi:hypothetical protein
MGAFQPRDEFCGDAAPEAVLAESTPPLPRTYEFLRALITRELAEATIERPMWAKKRTQTELYCVREVLLKNITLKVHRGAKLAQTLHATNKIHKRLAAAKSGYLTTQRVYLQVLLPLVECPTPSQPINTCTRQPISQTRFPPLAVRPHG